MPELELSGDSRSSKRQKKNITRILERFVRFDASDSWDNLTEAVLCSGAFYLRLAHWLINEYKIPPKHQNGGHPLSCPTIIGYMRMIINRAATKFEERSWKTAAFPTPKWNRKLKDRILRLTFKRYRATGELGDHSATPVYLTDVMLLQRSYARANTSQGAVRKFALLSSQRAAGRSSEIAWSTYANMQWDSHFKHVFVDIVQNKPAKLKLAAFGAGATRHADWFLALGDYLVLQPNEIYSEDQPNWLIPRLQETSAPGTTLTRWIQDVLPSKRGGHSNYQDKRLVLPQLPPGATAAGLRRGASNELAAAMPTALAVLVTGHDCKKLSAFFEYLDVSRAGLMPGSVVLGGWPSGHGERLQMGKGPVPASLDALEELGFDMAKIDGMIDTLFRLDTASPPMLLRDGHLRPAVRAAFATMVMHFADRRQHDEMREVLELMMRALQKAGLVVTDAPGTLSTWGTAIKARFDLDNLHLMQREADAGAVQIQSALQQMGRQVSSLHTQVANLVEAVASLAPAMLPAGSRKCSHHAGAVSQAEVERLEAQLAAAKATAKAAAAAPQSQEPSSASLGCLLPSTDAAPAALTGKRAADMYREYMSEGEVVPNFERKREKSKAKVVYEWFNAMATPAEKAQLKPVPGASAELDEGARRKLVARLHELVRQRLVAAYPEGSKLRDLPKKEYHLPASGIDSNIQTLSGLKPPRSVDTAHFQVWRAEFEARESESIVVKTRAPKRVKR